MSLGKSVFLPFLVFSSLSFAKTISREPQQVGGDVGMRDIEIQDMEIKKAAIGSAMSFKGSDALSLHNTLPSLVVRDNPEDATGFIAHDQNHAVVVKCIKKQYNSARGTYETIPNGPLCSVTLKSAPENKNFSSDTKWIATESR